MIECIIIISAEIWNMNECVHHEYFLVLNVYNSLTTVWKEQSYQYRIARLYSSLH